MKTVAALFELLIDDSVPDETPMSEVYKRIPREKIEAAIVVIEKFKLLKK